MRKAFTGANLTDAVLMGVNLTGNITYTNLAGTIVSVDTLKEAIFM